MERTIPSSSTIPVNIQLLYDIGFDSELFRRDGMQLDVAHANRIDAAAAADTTGHGERLSSAQNLGRIVEENLVGALGFEHSPVEMAACLDNNRKHSLAAEPVDRATDIRASEGTIEHHHRYARFLD